MIRKISNFILTGFFLALVSPAMAQQTLSNYPVYDSRGNVIFTVEPKAGESQKDFEKRAEKEVEAFNKARAKQREIVSLSDYKILDDSGKVVAIIKPRENETLEAFEKRAKKEGEIALKNAAKPVKDTAGIKEFKIYDSNGKLAEIIKPKPGEKKEDFEVRAMTAAAEYKAASRVAASSKDIYEELTENYTILYDENGEELQKVYQRKGESNKDFKKRVEKIGRELATKKQ